jgi:4-amino-4-deoxy-L-arabinose transferase-like glycosyltransferase
MKIQPLDNRAGVTLFLVALVLRVGWVLLGGGTALQSSDDAKAYHDIAVNLSEHHQFVTTIDPPHRLDLPYAQRPPLTSYALSGIYSLFGPHLLAGQLFLACVGALSVVALYLLGRRFFSERTGIVAGILAALYPFFVFLSALPLTENLAVLLYTALALLLIASSSRRSMGNAVITGCVLGLAALDRPQILGFLPFLALLSFVGTQGEPARRMRWLGVAVVCSVAVVTPWTIRNRIIVGAWIPISLQGGAALYMGNNRYTQTPLDKQWAGARGWYDDPRWSSELVGLSPLETDRKAFHLATEFIGDHPVQSIGYSIQKVGLFFKAYANPIAKLSWYPVFALSLLGFYWTVARWRQLLPVYFLIVQTILTAAIFTSTPRFRAPVEPFFLLMAAYALSRLWERRTSKNQPS